MEIRQEVLHKPLLIRGCVKQTEISVLSSRCQGLGTHCALTVGAAIGTARFYMVERGVVRNISRKASGGVAPGNF